MSRAFSTSMSATSSASSVSPASARRVPYGSTIWLQPQNSPRRSLPTRFAVSEVDAVLGRAGDGDQLGLDPRGHREVRRVRDEVCAPQGERPRHLGEAQVVADLDADPAERRVPDGRARRRERRSGRRRGTGGASSGSVPIRPSGPTRTAALRSDVAVALEQAADDVHAEPRALALERLGRRAGDLLGERQRLLGALEHVAGDRALGQDEELAPRLRRPPPSARGTPRGFAPSRRAWAPSGRRRPASGASLIGSAFAMRRIRFYYDVVCPYSYMESHAVEAAEDAGEVEVEWLPFELRPAPRPLLEPRGDHLRVDWTQNVYRRALGARDRDPPAALPAALDAPARRLPLGGASRAGCATSSTRSTRRSSARARTSRPTPRSPAPPDAPGSTPTRRSRPPTRPSASRSSRRSGPRPRRRGSAACPRS